MASPRVAIPVYSGVDALDVVGPSELFGRAGYQVELIGDDTEPVRTEHGLRVLPDVTYHDRRTERYELLLVPAGNADGVVAAMQSENLQGFLREAGAEADLVAAVCGGSLILAAAGLLDGYRATTHWALLGCLRQFAKVEVVNGHPRYLVDRDRVTGGGTTSGLDQALEIVTLMSDEETARQVQLEVQYNPGPPYDDGDPAAADYSIYKPVHDQLHSRWVEPISKAVKDLTGL